MPQFCHKKRSGMGPPLKKEVGSETRRYTVIRQQRWYSWTSVWQKTRILPKKSAKQENSSLFMNSILLNRKMRVENQTKTRLWKDLSLCPEISNKNAVQEFRFWTGICVLVPYLLKPQDQLGWAGKRVCRATGGALRPRAGRAAHRLDPPDRLQSGGQPVSHQDRKINH